ncbi:MAG: transposase [Betaproteobacteria bacterium]|nr:transposase [Betaproteobacteria bacterium]
MTAEDVEGRKKLAGYMLRAPMSLEKLSYDAATGTVIYRSKMHAGLKRNFQVMPGVAWLTLLYEHIPDRYVRLVRYMGVLLEPRPGRAGKNSFHASRCRAWSRRRNLRLAQKPLGRGAFEKNASEPPGCGKELASLWCLE